MAKFSICTIGCKTNQYESQGMREILRALGWREVRHGQSATVAVVNTCAVTAHAETTSRRHLRQALRVAERVVLTGCAVNLHRPWTFDLPPAAIRLRNEEKSHLAEMLGLAASIPAAHGDFPLAVGELADHHRALIKIQDGCAGVCSYCVIAAARGRPRSRTLDEIVAEGRRLVANGYRELVLTGINIGAYCGERGEDLAAVVRLLADLPGLGRLRLGSVEPQLVTDDLLASMRHPAVCPHLHLPLQSGDDSILRAMRRPYTVADFLRTVERVRQALAQPAITTDVIVGFPGEGEEEFAHTMATCQVAAFARMHIFPFSPRPGTIAAAMPNAVPPRALAARKRRLLALAAQQAEAFARQWLHRELQVYVESWRNGIGRGYSDRYVRIAFPCQSADIGSVASLTPTAWRKNELWAPSACIVAPSLIHSRAAPDVF